MSWKITEHYREILAHERYASGFALLRPEGAPLRVALVYPNTYPIAMGNLGFQMICRFFNDQPDTVCERFFLPSEAEAAFCDKSNTPLVSLESQTPLNSFDLVCFSISFENDYLNLPRLFSLGRLPLRSKDRSDRHPLCVAGGAGITINAEPIADFFDLVFIGEGEDAVPEITAAWLEGHSKQEKLERIAAVEGVYTPSQLPSLSPLDHDPLWLAGYKDGFPRTSLATLRQYKKRRCRDFNSQRIQSQILSTRAEFGQMFLIEMERGCGRGCKFCAEGFIYLPFREKPFDVLKEQVLEGLKHQKKIGLIGGDLLSHHHFVEICRFIHDRGGQFSPSSVRLDALTDEIIDLFVESGHQTLAIAPEGGSERLRFMINKRFTNAQVIDAARRLARKGIPNIKLYIIVGLPTETEDDLRETIALIKETKDAVVAESRERGKVGRLIVSINPFIPKPRTPLQNSPFAGVNYFKTAIRKVQSDLSSLGGIKVNVESPLYSQVQVLLSNGPRDVSHFIEAYSKTPENFRPLLKEFLATHRPIALPKIA